MAESFWTQLTTYRGAVGARLRELLRYADSAPAPLREAMEYSLLANGKRLRPILTMLAAEAAGGTSGDALSVGCAVEMVHTYSLIHDDLPAMDDDDFRRGMPTSHKQFGEALAILAGDALLTLAFQVVACEYPAEYAGPCVAVLAEAAGATGMVAGQVEDLTWDGKISGRSGSQTLSDLERVHSRKTGAMFLASLRLGVIVGGRGQAQEVARKALEVYGRCFGLAFQITDDLLDVTSDLQRTGKRVGKDQVRGKLTYPSLLGLEESESCVRALRDEGLAALLPLGVRGEPLAALLNMIVGRET